MPELSREQWINFVDKIRNSDPIKRQQWVDRQPPLISSLDPNDAEDDTNPTEAIKGRENANLNPPVA